MRATWALATLVAISGIAFSGGAGTEKGQSNNTRFQRETPTVLAVRKTKDSIVTIKVQKNTSRKETVGTGVVVDERGYIVTNKHVVNGYVEIKATLADGTTYPAEVDFEEGAYDLAVLKIKAPKKLTPLLLGPATDLMVGEEVIAIGHPFGYVNTVSKGIISALDREIEMPSGVTLKNLIQVTAAINPGNSGGPLLNINGELIGINVALRQDAQGIAWALNADAVQQVLSRRLSASRKSGLYHGMDCREKVETEGEVRSRVMVYDVATNTPAASAGVKEGDEIIKLGDYRVGNRFDVERALWDVKSGETVQVTVVRSGRSVLVPMKIQGEVSQTASR